MALIWLSIDTPRSLPGGHDHKLLRRFDPYAQSGFVWYVLLLNLSRDHPKAALGIFPQ